MTHPTANKGVVVERLSDYYNIPLEHVVTVGDQANDVLMFKRSGMSIAMGNASEGVRKEATFVTSANTDEGFAKAVEEFRREIDLQTLQNLIDPEHNMDRGDWVSFWQDRGFSGDSEPSGV